MNDIISFKSHVSARELIKVFLILTMFCGYHANHLFLS